MDKVHVHFPRANISSQHSSHRRFAHIYARDRPFVRSVLLRRGIPARDVDDLVQNVFVVLWQRLGGIVGDGDVRPWLYAVAVNLAKNYRCHSRWRREWFVGEMPDTARTAFNPEWVIDAYRCLARMWRRMRTKVREVFMRVVLEGQSLKEAAKALGKSPKTVHSQMRGLRRLGRPDGCIID